MKQTTLRGAIARLDERRLRTLIFEFASLRKENTDWLKAKFLGAEDITELLERYKGKITHAFHSRRINLRKAKQAIADFKKISNAPKYIVELMIFYVETGIALENEYGDLYESFYASIESVYEKIILILNKNPQFISEFKQRLSEVVDNSSEGWGHRDTLYELYKELKGDNE